LLLIELAFISTLISCKKEVIEGIDFRQEMRDFVMEMNSYAESKHPGFLVIPQNGQELLTDNGRDDGVLQTDYVNSIDATGREDLFFGYDNDDVATPLDEKNQMLELCRLSESVGIQVLTIDYCSTHSKMDESYNLNFNEGFISFAASERELNVIPDYPEKPFNENSKDVSSFNETKNFLYLINSENFNSKSDFINAVSLTNYDALVIDLFHNEQSYSSDEINLLKTKNNGGKRLVVCYMSIGEAEDYRFYWNNQWIKDYPDWLDKENPEWEGNYKVKYWNDDWQNIIYGSSDSYLDKILEAGFDGVYLDIIDAFEYFED